MFLIIKDLSNVKTPFVIFFAAYSTKVPVHLRDELSREIAHHKRERTPRQREPVAPEPSKQSESKEHCETDPENDECFVHVERNVGEAYKAFVCPMRRTCPNSPLLETVFRAATASIDKLHHLPLQDQQELQRPEGRLP